MFQQMTSAIKRVFSRTEEVPAQLPELDHVDEHERQLAVYNARMTHRDYLIENCDKSQQQQDQLVFYIASAAFGVCITQASTVTTWLEIIALLFATIALFLSILVTYLSIESSTAAFESHLQDLESDQQMPYVISKKTAKIEADINWYNKAQLVVFSTGLLLLLFFSAARLIKHIFPGFLPL